MQRLFHNLGVDGVGRPAMKEPRHEELHERRMGIELAIIMARELIPGFMHRHRAVGFLDKAQHLGRINIE